MNQTKKMPDAYNKSIDSNLYKLLQLVNLVQEDFRADLLSIAETNDLNKAYGSTLDLYGDLLKVSRNGATDEQYRIKILNQIAVNTANTDCNSIISTISQMFGAENSSISIVEGDLQIYIKGLTIEMLKNSGYSSTEITKMIKKLSPIGVALSEPVYAGTLVIDSDEVYPAPTVANDYPILYSAWKNGQIKQGADGNYIVSHDTGLSGYGEVPETWRDSLPDAVKEQVLTAGDFEGGTLGLISGEEV